MVKKSAIKMFAQFLLIAVFMFGQIIRIAEALKFFFYKKYIYI